MAKSPGIRDAEETAPCKPPERWPDARIHHWCAMCIDFAGTTPIIIMEHAREKTIGGVLRQTRVHPKAKLGPRLYFVTAAVRPISTQRLSLFPCTSSYIYADDTRERRSTGECAIATIHQTWIATCIQPAVPNALNGRQKTPPD